MKVMLHSLFIVFIASLSFSCSKELGVESSDFLATLNTDSSTDTGTTCSSAASDEFTDSCTSTNFSGVNLTTGTTSYDIDNTNSGSLTVFPELTTANFAWFNSDAGIYMYKETSGDFGVAIKARVYKDDAGSSFAVFNTAGIMVQSSSSADPWTSAHYVLYGFGRLNGTVYGTEVKNTRNGSSTVYTTSRFAGTPTEMNMALLVCRINGTFYFYHREVGVDAAWVFESGLSGAIVDPLANDIREDYDEDGSTVIEADEQNAPVISTTGGSPDNSFLAPANDNIRVGLYVNAYTNPSNIIAEFDFFKVDNTISSLSECKTNLAY